MTSYTWKFTFGSVSWTNLGSIPFVRCGSSSPLGLRLLCFSVVFEVQFHSAKIVWEENKGEWLYLLF